MSSFDTLTAVTDRVTENVEKVIEGKTDVVRTAMTVLLAEGHLLIEDVPGTGKTMLAKTLARSIDSTVKRIQFTPDLLPSDVTGVSIYNRETRQFEFRPGGVFANIVVGDEINRASPKTQSALLECMEERQVTVDGTTYELAAPFMVIATQNPIEMEGTYPLPEAQRDRFMARVSMGYPVPEGRTGDARQPLRRQPARRSRAGDRWGRGSQARRDGAHGVRVRGGQAVRDRPDVGHPPLPRSSTRRIAAREPASRPRSSGACRAQRTRLRHPRRPADPRGPRARAPPDHRTRGPDERSQRRAGGGDRAAQRQGARARRSRAQRLRRFVMREALSTLTTRGRAFLSAGVTASVCAFILGQDDLLRIGLFLIALPVLTAWLAHRARYLLSCSRDVQPARLEVGQTATVTINLENPGRIPTGLMLLEDQVPYVLGSRPRFVVDQLRPRWHRSMAYQVRSEVRGRYTIGPLAVRLERPVRIRRADPFVHQQGLRGRDASRGPAAAGAICRVTGPAPATTGHAPLPPPAPRTSRFASTGSATTCAGSTGDRAHAPTS